MIGELAALAAAISWTISAVLYRKALTETRPILANIVRLGFTSGILLVVLLILGGFHILASLPADIITLASISGIIGLGIGDTFYMESLKKIGVARAVPLTCTYPLFSLVWAVLLVQQEVGISTVTGTAIIVIGIWLISVNQKNRVIDKNRRLMIVGTTLALGTAILWSISITMMDIAVTVPPQNDISFPFAINMIRAAAVSLILLILTPILDRNADLGSMRKQTILNLTLGGLVALGVGWFFLAYSFAIATPEARAVPISSTTPLFSTLLAVFFLHEKITAKGILGTVAIIAGIFLIFLI